MREQHLPAPLDGPAGEQRRAEVTAAGRMDHRGIEGVVVAERPGDPLDGGRVHLLQGQDVGAAETVALEDLDGPVDLQGVANVEGGDAEGGIGRGGGGGTGREVALESGTGEAQEVGRLGARAEGEPGAENEETAEPRREPDTLCRHACICKDRRIRGRWVCLAPEWAEKAVPGRYGRSGSEPGQTAAGTVGARGKARDAYAQLAGEGYLELRPGARPKVTGCAGPCAPPTTQRVDPAPEPRYDFRSSMRDLSAFPRSAWLRSVREALARMRDADLGYTDRHGSEVLRLALRDYLGRVRPRDAPSVALASSRVLNQRRSCHGGPAPSFVSQRPHMSARTRHRYAVGSRRRGTFSVKSATVTQLRVAQPQTSTLSTGLGPPCMLCDTRLDHVVCSAVERSRLWIG